MFKEEQEEEYIGPLVVCDGCQDPVLGPRYTCINTYRRRKCGFNLHKSCAELPREIQHPMHRQHPLFLLNTIQNIKVRCFCKACNQLCRFRYNCSTCDFNLDLKCNGCIRPITTTTNSFYWCTKKSCHFFLHKICAELPKKMFLPSLHSHPLTLLPRAPSFDGVFQCEMCGIFSQGFAYTCEECASPPDGVSKTVFYLDLECSIYWENKALKHDSHAHRLLLNMEWDKVYCSGCSSLAFFCFSCKRCNFHLCVSCVKLPLTARHRYDNHPLKLTYDSVKTELGEYYCELCEGTRDPTQWFYYCKDCDFDCHPHCILGRYPQVKLGSTYKHDAHGQHLVTLVAKSESPIPNDKRYNILPCDKCGKPCEGLVFECKECNVNIHRDCLATDLESSSKSTDKS